MSPTTSRPTTVTIVFWLILLGLILDLVAAIIAIAGGVALGSSGQAVEASPLGSAGFISVGVVTLVLVLIELIVLFQLRAGKNWARIVITILEVLGLLSLLSGTGAITVLGGILSVVIIVLLWVPSSSAYFAARR